MELVIAAVGRAGKGAEGRLAADYLSRLPWSARIVEVEERRPLSPVERKRREADKLLAAVPDNAFLVALDEGGRQMNSAGFAEQLERWRGLGRPLAFAIGGADGHGPPLLERADATLSLSAMTWPHMLVRLMLAEQLFRAWSIQAGHPYHRA